MNLARYRFVLSRPLQLLPVLFGISLITFVLVRSIPGDPARALLGSRSTPDALLKIRAQYGLDQPLWLQYFYFLKNLLKGDLGQSLLYKVDALKLIVTRIEPTLVLVLGSVVLALLAHFGADAFINTLLLPVTHWWLGLPVALGVPILFGVLRKELSLLMVYQALGSQDIAPLLDWVQIATFLVFLTFYVPCVSTFAVMLKTIGRRDALFSLGLSVAVALGVAALCRIVLQAVNVLI